MFQPQDFSCTWYKHVYICAPRNAPAKDGFLRLQHAIDGLLNKIPELRDPTTGRAIPQNPIGTGSGYDGRIGPDTRGLGLTALQWAAKLVTSAGEGVPKEAQDVLTSGTQDDFSAAAVEVAAFLEDVATRFDTLVVTLTKPVTPPLARSKKGLIVIGGLLLFSAAIGVTMASKASKEKPLDTIGPEIPNI